ncbi:AAA family ATPase [Sinorhizobium meliloti]|nr:AAA family ATPase [Sinorhizobium meliloti]MDW9912874.1 AAA family ATPase [Sinorhizobium meliloti]MDW9943976.1 AAA family ATPase [Sinorhizobium meliloti]
MGGNLSAEGVVEDSPDWDPSQLFVITQPSNARLIVDAGPGTGKTAVACARVAHLINEGALSPRGVWLISFTRTAVKEIRDRIRSYLNNPDALYGVKIATIDSHAWSIHQGFAPNAALTGSFDDNIARVIELIDSDDEVRDYIAETNHLIIDEAQDLVGLRADLVVGLVERLSPDAGVTVFADDAQAIYGFAGDAEEDGPGVAAEGLTVRLIALGGFSRTALDVVHRTKSPGLLQIFTGVRAMVVAPGEDPATRLAQVRDAVAGHADNNTDTHFDPNDPGGDGVFVLFRRRSEVLQASSFLCQRQVPHRLRMSGLPSIIPPWLGAALGEFTAPLLTRDEFLARCIAIAAEASRPPDAALAWNVLESLAPGQRGATVEVRRLRNLLGRAQPPAEIASPDYGASGPILGTIHAAKGRETDDVWMMLPVNATEEDPDVNVDLDEETRVVFVGATRARKTLTVGRGYKRLIASNLEGSGRVYSVLYEQGKARLEIGRSGDIAASGVASRLVIGSAPEARDLQHRLAQFDGVALPVRADCDRASSFIYRISAVNGGASWGAFSQWLNGDLFKIAEAVRARHGRGRRRPPDYFLHLYLTGVRTIVLRPDDPELEQLHEPWRTSGIMLAPMVHGFVTTLFPFRR